MFLIEISANLTAKLLHVAFSQETYLAEQVDYPAVTEAYCAMDRLVGMIQHADLFCHP
jgi:hypothetical protein